ncbi:nucleolar pre-ribosomal-associated protein 1 [Geosmithia morbida]|uniref:Nucleolar pre-ribosomal-associated protein 1 n=1 Tax=Geosmithia morbida TaxID=1094350 RepID=A0A9P4Z0P7_9HYPO|nr:nucleolar pre-ribosomal-associated protein 1 [Geosmithia morbida]KAF4125276.1 nucleolar pre-ribosomal-associated protein 1 [Geosmithia morbida]
MSKRVVDEADGAAAYRKRQKVVHEVPTGEPIHSSDQLRRLLAFDQDLRQARHGLQSFKQFLDQFNSDEDHRDERLQILQQYLDSVKPRHIDDEAVYLSDVMETWSFAVQVNNDGVMSSVAVVLALLLQIVSGYLQLVPHGLGMCQTLIQERQLKSLSRNLSCDKNKGFVISPTLRLLREAVCLDGGVYAKRIFRARSSTFASLARNLEIAGPEAQQHEDARRTSVRTNAVRFLLSCLKFLHSDGRKELLSQRELLSHVTFMLKTDPPYVVTEILDSLKTHVLMDERISRDIKLRSFNTKTLVRILGLYTYGTGTPYSEQDRAAVAEKAHQFLVYVCTSPTAGVLYPSTGLYPKPSDDESTPASRRRGKSSSSSVARLVEGPLMDAKYADEIPVYNFVLSEFAQKLKPWSSLRHNQLLVAMFRAAPELVADYFLNNRSFTFEPKLSMTWIGYAAFLFNTMQIPLPESFGDSAHYASGPPPTSILLDNIIPLPINQKVLSRCFSLKSNLTSFFATRILISALEKLTQAVAMHHGKAGGGGGDDQDSSSLDPAWTDASRRLVDAFCQRIPDMKDIVHLYKTVPTENLLHKTLASRLLRLYYEAVPRVALAANFDVSPLLVEVLRKLSGDSHSSSVTVSPDAKAFGIMELENLVSIAGYSPGMRWFAKIDNDASPFTALLRLLCGDDQSTPSRQIRAALETVAMESQIVSKSAGLKPVLQALRAAPSLKSVSSMATVWTFMDNCLGRCASSPLKYLELLGTYTSASSTASSDLINLLNVAIVEQLPFATSSLDDESKKSLARFLPLYFTAAGHENSIVRALYSQVQTHLKSAGLSVKNLVESTDTELLSSTSNDFASSSAPNADPGSSSYNKSSAASEAAAAADLEARLGVPLPTADHDTNTLVKWTTRNVEDLIEDGWASRLISLLASEHVHIRKEALTNILKMASKVKESSYEEREQIWLLLSELAESSRPLVDGGTSPVPSPLIAFATHSLDVLRSPLHPLYAKVNTFLTRSPVWPASKVPLAHDVLHGQPSDDDRYYAELTWLLGYMLDGLVTPADVDVFRRQRWFEKILALGANPYLRGNLRTRILRILYRATCIPGASTTLVTRFGIVSWLRAQGADADGNVYRALIRRVWDTCDKERVRAWSKGGVERIVDDLE